MSEQFDVFISYARKDNLPEAGRLISHVHSLLGSSNDEQTSDLEVFFDTSDIQDRADWRARILRGLSQAKVLLIFVSPSYFESKPCRWEWDEYLGKIDEIQMSLGLSGIVPVLLGDAPDEGLDEARRRWRNQVLTYNAGLDLRAWYGRSDVEIRASDDLRSAIEGLGQRIAHDLVTPAFTCGNLPQPSSPFVGRYDVLKELHHKVFRPKSAGGVTVVTGAEGVGKTELLIHYSRWHPRELAGCSWVLGARGQSDLTALMANLAGRREFRFQGTEPMRDSPQAIGRAVLEELSRRGETSPSTLVWLDNVTEPDLLRWNQISQLAADQNVRFVATTRLKPEDFGDAPRLQFLELAPLTIEDGVRLIERLQPVRDDGVPGFADAAQEASARELVELLEGNVVALRAVASVLGRDPSRSPSEYLAEIRGASVEGGLADAVLVATIRALGDESRMVLRLAAMLPPDLVPWPWLKQLHSRITEGVGGEDSHRESWGAVKASLEGQVLMNPGIDSATARLQDAVVRVALATCTPSEINEAADAVDSLLRERANAVVAGRELADWEYRVLVDSLLRRVGSSPDLASAINLRGLPTRLGHHVGDDSPYRLAKLVQGIMEQRGLGATERAAMVDRVVALNNFGVQVRRTRGDEARAWHTQAAAIAQALVDEAPGDAEAIDILADSLTGLAALDTTDAQIARRIVTLRERVAAHDQTNSARRQLLSAYEMLSRRVIKYDKNEALDLHRKALTIARSLVADRPTDFTARSELQKVLAGLARDLEFNDRNLALEYAEESLTIARGLAAEQSGNLTVRSWLATALNAKARLLPWTDRDDAVHLAREAVVLAEEVSQERPGDLEALRSLAFPLSTLARKLEKAKPEEALGHFERALEINRTLVEMQPDSNDALRGLAIALNDNARALLVFLPTARDKALRYTREALQLDQEAHERRPESMVPIRGLAVTHNRVAELLELDKLWSTREPIEALEHAYEARARTRQFLEMNPQHDQMIDLLERLDERIERLERLSGPVSDARADGAGAESIDT